MQQAMWLAFGAVWDLAALGLISLETEEALNLACDFSAKVCMRVACEPVAAVGGENGTHLKQLPI